MITLDRQELLGALKRCSSVARRNDMMPSFSNITVSCDGDYLCLRAMSLSSEVEEYVSVNQAELAAKSGMRVRVSARRFRDMVDALDGKSVWLKVDGDSLRFGAGKRVFELASQGVGDERCSLLGLCPPSIATVPASLLVALIDRTEYVMSKYWNACLLEISDRMLRMVSLDDHRLARAVCEGEVIVDGFGSSSISTLMLEMDGVGELASWVKDKLARDEAVVVEVCPSETVTFFRSGRSVIASKAPSYSFPDYSSVMNTEWTCRARVDRAAFLEALHVIRVSEVLSRIESPCVAFEFGESGLVARSAREQTFPCETEVCGTDVYAFDGKPPFRISFNTKFVEDAVKRMNSEYIEIYMSDTLRPGKICSTDKVHYKRDGHDFEAEVKTEMLLAPIRL